MDSGEHKPQQPAGMFFLKIIFVGIILVIGLIILFGFIWADFDPVEFIFNIFGLILMLALLSLAIKGIISFLKPKPFSPTDSFRDNLIRIAIKAKPFNVKRLFLRGEDMHTYAKWGKIKGMGFLPYLSSQPIKDKNGKIVYETDENNKIIYEKTWNYDEKDFIEKPKIKYEMITEKDGDNIFIVDKAPFPFNMFIRGVDVIRANPKYCSDLIGDIFIKDVNLVPYGEFLYPAKQWQETILQIMKENEATAISTTHRDNLDMVSIVTQMSLGSDPTFQKIMLAQSERLSSGLTQAGGQ